MALVLRVVVRELVVPMQADRVEGDRGKVVLAVRRVVTLKRVVAAAAVDPVVAPEEIRRPCLPARIKMVTE